MVQAKGKIRWSVQHKHTMSPLSQRPALRRIHGKEALFFERPQSGQRHQVGVSQAQCFEDPRLQGVRFVRCLLRSRVETFGDGTGPIGKEKKIA